MTKFSFSKPFGNKEVSKILKEVQDLIGFLLRNNAVCRSGPPSRPVLLKLVGVATLVKDSPVLNPLIG